jgi:hypothetical protein
MAMSPQARNHGGGVDSGGAGHTIVARLLRKVQVFPVQGGGSIGSGGQSTSYITDDGKRLANPDGPAAADRIEAQSRLLTKSLCTLQALASNMEESGEGVEAVARAIFAQQGTGRSFESVRHTSMGNQLFKYAQAAITAVLGTFDLEALKTLVGEIDDVLGGSR